MSQTIDLTPKHWGRDYVFDPKEDGMKASISGWSTPLPEVGDYLILRNGAGTTRYQIDSIHYPLDPKDMFFAQASFAPRPAP
jgi:hypothetical protein